MIKSGFILSSEGTKITPVLQYRDLMQYVLLVDLVAFTAV
jgi:hypothetical protein